jgi:hypothetical protein
MAGNPDAVRVAVRVKPLSDYERESGVQKCVRLADGQIVVGGQRPYAFDHMYAPEVPTERLYHELVEPLIDESFLCGFNATIFAYGQTGAGKTHTMNGVTRLAVRRICHFVREAAQERTDAALDENATIAPGSFTMAAVEASPPSLSVSMLELHNDTLADLLAGTPSAGAPQPALTIVEAEPGRGVYVKNLQECPVETEEDIERVIDYGAANRKTAETLMNQTSSRSHMMLTITLRYRGTTSKLNLVDLAGSERIKKSLGPLRPVGSANALLHDANQSAMMAQTNERLRECISINSGLLALGNVIEALCKKRSHIPFRQSKLTRILQDSLAGNCRTAMIACVSSSDHNTDESVSTLNYANRAKALVTRAVQNITVGVEEVQAELAAIRRERDHFRSQLQRLQRQMGQQPDENASMLNVPPSAASGVSMMLDATTHSLDLGSTVAQRLHAEREAFMQLQAELAETRRHLAECASALDNERRVTRVLEDDLFKAEYEVMTSKEALRQLRRELAEARGLDPAVEGEDDGEHGGGHDTTGEERITSGEEDEGSIFDARQHDPHGQRGRDRDRELVRLEAGRARCLDQMASAVAREAELDRDAEDIERYEQQQQQQHSGGNNGRHGGGGGGNLPPPSHGGNRAAAIRQQQLEDEGVERQLKQHEVLVHQLRDELDGKQRLIEHLTASCDFAEAQVAEFEERCRNADYEAHKLHANLQEALRKLESKGESQQQRDRIVASYNSRMQAQKVAVQEYRRKLEEAQASLRAKLADRERVSRLQQEATQLADRLREREDAHRKMQGRARAVHQQELTQLHKALRDAKAENRRMVATFRKKEEEFRVQIATLQREGAGRHHHPTHLQPTMSHVPPTPRGQSTALQREDTALPATAVAHHHQQHHHDRDRGNKEDTAEAHQPQHTHRAGGRGGAAGVAEGGGGAAGVHGRLMAHTASSRARVRDATIAALAPDAVGGAPRQPPLTTLGSFTNTTGTPPRDDHSPPRRRVGQPKESLHAGAIAAASSSSAEQPHNKPAPSPSKNLSDSLYQRLDELDKLDRELEAITDERDRRASEIAEIKQSYNVHRTQRALEAWRYYAQQLAEKIRVCTDVDELEQLEAKVVEVRSRIQALEEGHANACADKEEELRMVEEHLDSLRVKRVFLIKIIRGLQQEQHRSLSRDRGDDRGAGSGGGAMYGAGMMMADIDTDESRSRSGGEDGARDMGHYHTSSSTAHHHHHHHGSSSSHADPMTGYSSASVAARATGGAPVPPLSLAVEGTKIRGGPAPRRLGFSSRPTTPRGGNQQQQGTPRNSS